MGTGRVVLAVFAGAAVWAVMWVGGAMTAAATLPGLPPAGQPVTQTSVLLGYIVYSVALSVLAGYVAATVGRGAREYRGDVAGRVPAAARHRLRGVGVVADAGVVPRGVPGPDRSGHSIWRAVARGEAHGRGVNPLACPALGLDRAQRDTKAQLHQFFEQNVNRYEPDPGVFVSEPTVI